MPVFNIAEKESKEIAKATFHKASDYKAVTQVGGSGEPVLLHKIHADKLIAKKLYVLAKDVKVDESEPAMTTTKMEK